MEVDIADVDAEGSSKTDYGCCKAFKKPLSHLGLSAEATSVTDLNKDIHHAEHGSEHTGKGSEKDKS